MKMKLLSCLGALAGALSAGSSPGQAAVSVYGEATSSGPTVTVSLYADILTTPLMSFGARVFYDPLNVYVITASKNTGVWYFSDGTNLLSYVDPDVSKSGEVLILGGKLDARAPLQGVSGQHVLLGTVTFGRLTQAIPSFSLGLGRPAPYANFAAPDATVLDSQQGAIVIGTVTPDSGDTNLNGLRDDWELQYFKTLGKYTWSDDPDHDGFNNLQEQALGSDPTDPLSNLRLSITLGPKGALLTWASFPNRVYTLHSSSDLPQFQPFQTSIRATPPTNQFLQPIGPRDPAAFFRISLQYPLPGP